MSKTGLKRNIIDKFYTSQETVTLCMDKIKENLNIDKNKDIIVEPSAGNGAFIPKIKDMCSNYKFYDIAPENDEVVEKDFLRLWEMVYMPSQRKRETNL